MNQNLKLRIITALTGLPVILGLLIYGGVAGVTFFAWVISTAMLYEFCSFTFTLPDAKMKTLMVLVFNTLIFGLNLALGIGLSHAFLGLVPLLFFFTIFMFKVPALRLMTIDQDQNVVLQKHIHELMAICFGFTYCGWLPLLMVKIREHQNGMHWVLLTLLIVWATDTGAYFAGRFLGKKLLFPTVSPKKTWSGAFGGTVVAVGVTLLYGHFFISAIHPVELAIVALVTSAFSQVGDLCESLLKRAVNVKDSSGILPGHGGVMDRFDSLIFALPIMNAYLWIFSGF